MRVIKTDDDFQKWVAEMETQSMPDTAAWDPCVYFGRKPLEGDDLPDGVIPLDQLNERETDCEPGGLLEIYETKETAMLLHQLPSCGILSNTRGIVTVDGGTLVRILSTGIGGNDQDLECSRH